MITADAAAYRALLDRGGRLAGLDVGTRTIGLAYCDAGWTIASPAETLKRGKFSADLAALAAVTKQQLLVGLVVGLPLNLDGSDSPRTQSVRAFARNLAPLALPVLLWDERWSTQAVTRTLLDADASRARRAELVDKMAAAYILQGAIDAMMSGGHDASN
jgi:putative Holliday junction resolvase